MARFFFLFFLLGLIFELLMNTTYDTINEHTLIELVGTRLRHSQELNFEVVGTAEGKVCMRMPYDRKIIGDIRSGAIHGGALTALLDTCLGCVAVSAHQENLSPSPTLDLRMDYIQRPEAKDVYAEAELIRAGRDVIFVKGIAHQGDSSKPIAQCHANYMHMEASNREELLAMLIKAMDESKPENQVHNVNAQAVIDCSLEGTLIDLVKRCRDKNDLTELVDCIPYAQTIGATTLSMGEEKVYCLPFKESNIGNPLLPALHGGVISGFMELAAALHTMLMVDSEQTPRIIDFSLDYLRAGKPVDTYAHCEVVRQGRKIVNVAVTAWQDSRELPIATARCHFLLG